MSINNLTNSARLRDDFAKVLAVIEKTPPINKQLQVEKPEFMARVAQVQRMLIEEGVDVKKFLGVCT